MERCDRLLRALGEKGIGGAIITSPSNRRYFSGFTGSNGMLFISGETRALITDFRYIEQAKRQCAGFDIRPAARSMEYEQLNKAVQASRSKLIGFEAQNVSVERYGHIEAALKGIRCEPIDATLAALRSIKSPEELAKIRQAAGVADDVFLEMLDWMRPGRTEAETAAYLEYRLKLLSDGPSFPPIIASGENGALPHAAPSGKELKEGELVVMDFGAVIDGYCSDMTRTVALGHADGFSKEIYNTVLRAQVAALDILTAQIPANIADEAARASIRRAGYGELFGHGLGHGVGLDVHEAPTLGPSSEDTLLEGMVVTVEPGIYITGRLGVRIEDLCCIIPDGKQNMTSSIKSFVVI